MLYRMLIEIGDMELLASTCAEKGEEMAAAVEACAKCSCDTIALHPEQLCAEHRALFDEMADDLAALLVGMTRTSCTPIGE